MVESQLMTGGSASAIKKKAKVLLCGYYGEHNLGDDAYLQVLVSQLPVTWDPVITARDHQAAAALVPGACIVNRRSLSETISASGKCTRAGWRQLAAGRHQFQKPSLLPDPLWVARFNRIPIILWGQGLGPFNASGAVGVFRQRCAESSRSPERSRLIASGTAMAVADADGDGAGSCLVPSSTGLVGWSGPDSLPPTDTAAEHPRLADVVAGPGFSAPNLAQKVIWLAFHGDQDAALWNDLDQQNLIPAACETARCKCALNHSTRFSISSVTHPW